MELNLTCPLALRLTTGAGVFYSAANHRSGEAQLGPLRARVNAFTRHPSFDRKRKEAGTAPDLLSECALKSVARE
jgi:hypothetical protein